MIVTFAVAAAALSFVPPELRSDPRSTAYEGVSMPADLVRPIICPHCGRETDQARPWISCCVTSSIAERRRANEQPRAPQEPLRKVPEGMSRIEYRAAIRKLLRMQRKARRKK